MTTAAQAQNPVATCAAAKRVEKEDETEEKRQAELRRAKNQLKECLTAQDSAEAAAANKKY